MLVWEYESRDEFVQAQERVRAAGWTVDEVKEIKRPVSAARLVLLGPIAFFARPTRMRATLRPREQQSFRGWTTESLLEPRMTEARSRGKVRPLENGKSSPKDASSQASDLEQDGDDQQDVDQDAAGSTVYTQDVS
jgi:hypothetical protein